MPDMSALMQQFGGGGAGGQGMPDLSSLVQQFTGGGNAGGGGMPMPGQPASQQ